ncbi:MAG TPA: extracellular solute-binding protein [Candidatus Limnocylindrales bacterium]|nr:extracellular solute-binding protein [Candidatus Limnocylindrales bacterium]
MATYQSRGSQAIILGLAAILAVAACAGPATSPSVAPASPGGGASPGASASGGAQLGGSLNVWTAWGGDELKAFQAVLQPFIDQTGIQVNLLTIRDQDLQLSNNVAAGTSLPDIANPPNPQRYTEWAQKGIMKPIEDFIDMDAYLANTLPGLLLEDPNYGFVDGKHYLLMVKSQLKGLLWYNPKNYTGQAPETWDALIATPPAPATNLFCAAFESGDASGWPASDAIANIIMRQSGEKVYVDWYEGRHKWTSPEIKLGYQTLGQMVKNDALYGGTNYALSTNFQRGGDGLFSTPPGCLFLEQATFIPQMFVQNDPTLKAGDNFNFFPHPKFNDEFAGNVEGFFDTFVMYNDTPQARALMQYMVTDEAQQTWVDKGGTLAASKNITKYPDVLGENAAKILQGSKNILLTAGDYMPADMQRAFWKSLLDFTNDQSQLDSILANLDQVQASSYAPAASPSS